MAREDTGLRRRVGEEYGDDGTGRENDVTRGARRCIEKGQDPNSLGMGQREGEDAETMQADIRARVAELQDEAQLASIKKRFDALPGLHPGIEWADVQAALLKDPETLRKIMAFDAKGHAMNVMEEENGEFVFVSCWTDYRQVSSDHRNIVFDRKAAEALGSRYPDKNRNAVKIVGDMGAELADEKYHNQLRGVTGDEKYHNQLSRVPGVNGWVWLKTDESTREAGDARVGYDYGVYPDLAYLHHFHGSFRAELRVKKD